MREKQLKIASEFKSHHQAFLSAITRVLCSRQYTLSPTFLDPRGSKQKTENGKQKQKMKNRRRKKNGQQKMESSKRKTENEKQSPIPADLILELAFLLKGVAP